jgi:hypothetical protein
MARKIGTIKHHGLGLETPLRLEVDEFLFIAEWKGQDYSDTDGHALRKKVLAAMAETNETWHKVIAVRRPGRHDRILLATTGDRFFLTRHWKNEAQVRKHHHNFGPSDLPYRTKYTCYFAYSEELWQALKRNDRLTESLEEIVESIVKGGDKTLINELNDALQGTALIFSEDNNGEEGAAE